MKKNCAIRIAIYFFAFQASFSYAQDTCHGQWVNPLTDVCWSCLFPLTLGAIPLVASYLPDTENPLLPVCFCATP